MILSQSNLITNQYQWTLTPTPHPQKLTHLTLIDPTLGLGLKNIIKKSVTTDNPKCGYSFHLFLDIASKWKLYPHLEAISTL